MKTRGCERPPAAGRTVPGAPRLLSQPTLEGPLDVLLGYDVSAVDILPPFLHPLVDEEAILDLRERAVVRKALEDLTCHLFRTHHTPILRHQTRAACVWRQPSAIDPWRRAPGRTCKPRRDED